MAYKAKSITSKASSACRMNMASANSPAKIAPAIMAAAPAIIGALSKGKEEKRKILNLLLVFTKEIQWMREQRTYLGKQKHTQNHKYGT